MSETVTRTRVFRCACCGCKRESEDLPRGWSWSHGAMSAEACACRSCRHPKKTHLPIYATGRALEQARALMRPGVVLEVEVGWALGRGEFYPLDGGKRAVAYGVGWRASLARKLSRLSEGRYVWMVTDVTTVQPRSEETR